MILASRRLVGLLKNLLANATHSGGKASISTPLIVRVKDHAGGDDECHAIMSG
jgi:hypothetical protein